jgi:hypothetical protein
MENQNCCCCDASIKYFGLTVNVFHTFKQLLQVINRISLSREYFSEDCEIQFSSDRSRSHLFIDLSQIFPLSNGIGCQSSHNSNKFVNLRNLGFHSSFELGNLYKITIYSGLISGVEAATESLYISFLNI